MTDVIILRRKDRDKTTVEGVVAAATASMMGVRAQSKRDLAKVEGQPSLLVRWGCTSLHSFSGIITLNSSESIHWCADKRDSRLAMQSAGVPVPESWGDADFFDAAHEDYFADTDMFVSRPKRHAQGKELAYGSATEVTLYSGGYVSRFIQKVAEYRVFVCQNRVVWVAKKTPGNSHDVAWNVSQGGRFDNVSWGEWPMLVCKAALQAAKVSGTDFCGVDIMVDAEGKPYVLELNSAPSQTSPYRQQCTAKVFDYIVRNGKEPLPDFEHSSKRTWKSYAHPAIRGVPNEA